MRKEMLEDLQRTKDELQTHYEEDIKKLKEQMMQEKDELRESERDASE